MTVVLWSPVRGQDAQTDTLRTTIAEWVSTMKKIQEEQARWSREKQILESNKEGLEQEIVDLELAIEAAKGRLASTGKEEQEDLDQKRQNDAAREALAVALTEAEVEARRVLPLLPEFLLKENPKLATAVDALEKTVDFTEEQKSKDLGKRLSSVVMVLTEAEKFHAQSWVRDEEREVKGKPMLLTTIYFGLSAAFSADQQGTVALRGAPGKTGWSFRPLPDENAERINDLIGVATAKGEIKFVDIPLELR